jgi:predicted short-subunit dehydrogenase-like oxidoreductase (DUF2520 family)
MARGARNSLETIHAALTDPVARGVLGALSTSDMEMLSRHAHAKTMTASLHPLLEHDDFEAAIAAMPEQFRDVIQKVPPDILAGVKSNLSAITPADGGPAHCPCGPNLDN